MITTQRTKFIFAVLCLLSPCPIIKDASPIIASIQDLFINHIGFLLHSTISLLVISMCIFTMDNINHSIQGK